MTKPDRGSETSAFQSLLALIDRLRGKNGCPWDRRQRLDDTPAYVLEEAYELAEAIEQNHLGKIKEELGDLVFLALFVAKILEDDNGVAMHQVIEANIAKMKQRHPHIFAQSTFHTEQEVLLNWEETKVREKKDGASIYHGLVRTLPALMLAKKVQEKASRLGFDWLEIQGPVSKLQEELDELAELAQGQESKERTAEEFGDILFSLVNVARHMDLEPEACLRKATDKFIHRFQSMEQALQRENKRLRDMDQQEMDDYWEEAKKTNSTQHN